MPHVQFLSPSSIQMAQVCRCHLLLTHFLPELGFRAHCQSR